MGAGVGWAGERWWWTGLWTARGARPGLAGAGEGWLDSTGGAGFCAAGRFSDGWLGEPDASDSAAGTMAGGFSAGTAGGSGVGVDGGSGDATTAAEGAASAAASAGGAVLALFRTVFFVAALGMLKIQFQGHGQDAPGADCGAIGIILIRFQDETNSLACRASGFVARQSEIHADMLLPHASPYARHPARLSLILKAN